MVQEAAPQDFERYRTPDRFQRRLIRVSVPANDNRRPGRRRTALWVALGAFGLAILGATYLLV